MNSSKKKLCVAGARLLASGWNCAEKKGLVLWRMPSLVPSFMLTKSVSHSSGSVSESTANPWFCDVTKHLSVPILLTGWLWERCPYLSL